MKNIYFTALLIVILSNVNAQVLSTTGNVAILNPTEWEAGINSVIDYATNATTETTVVKEDHLFLYPNPAQVGENVSIINITKGETVHIFDRKGTYMASQFIDLDEQLYTNFLTEGDYQIRTETLSLKLKVR